ncbi:MAG: hypothetical protein U0T83_07320 [Bacteriovoracaceae bacterium]
MINHKLSSQKGSSYICSKEICKNSVKSSVDLPYTLQTGESDAIFDTTTKTSFVQ